MLWVINLHILQKRKTNKKLINQNLRNENYIVLFKFLIFFIDNSKTGIFKKTLDSFGSKDMYAKPKLLVYTTFINYETTIVLYLKINLYLSCF